MGLTSCRWITIARTLARRRRAVRAVGESPLSERLARAQELAYGPLIEWVRRSPLHTDVLGHSLHPSLTDVTTGCWLGTSLLDLAGGSESRRGATLLAGFGLLASVPTALAGAGDWAEMSGAERRIGAVHGLGVGRLQCFLFAGSLVARLRGGHRIGTKLAIAGNLVMAESRQGATGFNTDATDVPPRHGRGPLFVRLGVGIEPAPPDQVRPALPRSGGP